PLPAGAPAVDASVRCVVPCWPVIDPLARYHYAQKLKAGGKPYPELADLVLPLHDQYWGTEEAMAEGNPVLALERGERVELPPVLYVQAERDPAHPRPHLDRFVAQYRKAGGHVDLQLYDVDSDRFIARNRAGAERLPPAPPGRHRAHGSSRLSRPSPIGADRVRYVDRRTPRRVFRVSAPSYSYTTTLRLTSPFSMASKARLRSVRGTRR